MCIFAFIIAEVMNDRKTITVSVITDLATDQRVIRICTTLQEMGFDVLVIARRFGDSLAVEPCNFKFHRFRCIFRKGMMQYVEFMLRLFFILLFRRTDYFLANDLDSLVPSYIAAKLRRKYLFYDTHEYFTGVPELSRSPFKRKVWKKLEDWIFPRLKTVYTVNNSLRMEYEKEYLLPLGVIRNVPVKMQVAPAQRPENWNGKIILLAQGAGLNTGRSCIEMIDALRFLDNRFHLVYIGGGTAWKDLKTRRSELHLENRIDMIDRMVPSKLRSFTMLADLGISMDCFDEKNYLFNLPNKVFDYLQAGIPIFATAIPEVRQIIDEYQCGVYLTDTTPEFIAKTITALFDDQKKYAFLKNNALLASEELCWEKEKIKLEEIYRPFL